MATRVQLNVAVVGAGLAGLAAALCLARHGHHVRVYEASPELIELGAGIQIPPNAFRILDSWGLSEEVLRCTSKPPVEKFRRYSNGKLIGQLRRNTGKEERFGYESLVIHRADFQNLLYRAALEAGVTVSFGIKIDFEDWWNYKEATASNVIGQADLVVAADGINSPARAMLLPGADTKPRLTGDCATRIILSKAQMQVDPRLAPLIEQPSNTVWMGPHHHAVAYTIRNAELLNVVLCGKGEAPIGIYNQPRDLNEVLGEYSDFEETVQAIIEAADKAHVWTISEVPPLPRWSSEDGRLVLLGDSAHAMMPYTAQGAAQCIEDAAVLGVCLSKASEKSDVARLLEVHKSLRQPRAERIQTVARGNKGLFGMEDGPEQEARDQRFAQSMKGEDPADHESNTSQRARPDANAPYGTPGFNEWLYGYDAMKEAETYFANANNVVQ